MGGLLNPSVFSVNHAAKRQQAGTGSSIGKDGKYKAADLHKKAEQNIFITAPQLIISIAKCFFHQNNAQR